jgi:hypothetical protein
MKVSWVPNYNFWVHRGFLFMAGLPRFVTLEGNMPRPKAHYSLVLKTFAEISNGVKRVLGQKAASGEQDGRRVAH